MFNNLLKYVPGSSKNSEFQTVDDFCYSKNEAIENKMKDVEQAQKELNEIAEDIKNHSREILNQIGNRNNKYFIDDLANLADIHTEALIIFDVTGNIIFKNDHYNNIEEKIDIPHILNSVKKGNNNICMFINGIKVSLNKIIDSSKNKAYALVVSKI